MYMLSRGIYRNPNADFPDPVFDDWFWYFFFTAADPA